MICSNCHAYNEDNAVVCTSCGTVFSQAQAQSPATWEQAPQPAYEQQQPQAYPQQYGQQFQEYPQQNPAFPPVQQAYVQQPQSYPQQNSYAQQPVYPQETYQQAYPNYQQPGAYPQQSYPQQPGYPQSGYGYGQPYPQGMYNAAADSKGTLALVGMICGFVAILGNLWMFLIGLLVGIGAVVLSVIGLKSNKKSMAYVGLALGALAIVLALVGAFVLQ